jgi:hypothetical protein
MGHCPPRVRYNKGSTMGHCPPRVRYNKGSTMGHCPPQTCLIRSWPFLSHGVGGLQWLGCIVLQDMLWIALRACMLHSKL